MAGRKFTYRRFRVTLEADGRWDVRYPADGYVVAENFQTPSLAKDWIDREWPEGAPQ